MNLPNGYTLSRRHLHAGNSSKHQRHGKPYVTITTIKDRGGDVVAQGRAACSKSDHPNKFIGRTLADSRALKAIV